MSRWLDIFIYRVNMGLLVFLTAGLLAVLIALITISYRAVSASLTNPAVILRRD